LLDRASDERATDRHPIRALASAATTRAVRVITGTQAARETAHADLWELDLHTHLHFCYARVWCNVTARRRLRAAKCLTKCKYACQRKPRTPKCATVAESAGRCSAFVLSELLSATR